MKAPNLEVNVECLLTTKMTVDIGEEYRLNDLLDNTEYPLRNPRVCLPIQELHLNGFQGKLKGHIFLDGYCTGLLMHSHSDHKYPLQVESPNAISYKNDYGHKWNVLFPFGIPLSKGDVSDLSALKNQFREVNATVHIIEFAPELIITPKPEQLIYFPLGIELSVDGKNYSSAGWIRKSEDSGSDFYVDYQQNWGQPRTYMYFPKNQSLENVIVKFSRLPESILYDKQEARAW